MAVSSEVLNLTVDYGTLGGPRYSTGIVETDAGFEARSQRWELPLVHAELGQKRMREYEWAYLRDFFHRRRGRSEAFLFRDWSDDRVLGGALGTGDGVTTTFQLVKHYGYPPTYTDGPTRTITRPTGIKTIYKDGVAVTSGVTLGSTTGIVTFSVAPANGVVLTADFLFYVIVRFDVDQLEATLVATEGGTTSLTGERFYDVGSVPLLEVRQ